MIIGTNMRHLIGERYIGPFPDDDGFIHPETPYLVLRAATKEEWIAEVRAVNTSEAKKRWSLSQAPPYFYEVSVD